MADKQSVSHASRRDHHLGKLVSVTLGESVTDAYAAYQSGAYLVLIRLAKRPL